MNPTPEPRDGQWIQTATGGIFYPLDPRPEEVHIEDIAHALSMKCRFAGHCLKFYSVAEHSVHVSRAAGFDFGLWGLLHDAAEAYSADIPRPIKSSLVGWSNIESRIMKAVVYRFGLVLHEPPEVKHYDDAILVTERDTIMAPCPYKWTVELPPKLDIELPCWSPSQAKEEFLKRYEELVG